MAHLSPLPEEALEAYGPFFAATAASMGFVPNSMKTMAHLPQLPVALMLLASTSFGGDLKAIVAQLGDQIPDNTEAQMALPPELIQLVAFACSTRAGCQYCQAHTAHSGHRAGGSQAQFAEILNFESSPAFSPAERAAVALAFAAAAVPNEAEAAHFEALRAHYSERQIAQLVAVIATFGFLNRWNDTMATALEAQPAGFAEGALGTLGWQAGKHS
ncbi:MAG: carboxymuconolactone decarboxylase family protein [Pseudomonadota bacterium]